MAYSLRPQVSPTTPHSSTESLPSLDYMNTEMYSKILELDQITIPPKSQGPDATFIQKALRNPLRAGGGTALDFLSADLYKDLDLMEVQEGKLCHVLSSDSLYF